MEVAESRRFRTGVPQPALSGDRLRECVECLGNHWVLSEGLRLEKQYTFMSFRRAVQFLVKVAEVVEPTPHRPELRVCHDQVRIIVRSGCPDGLTENEFWLAEKIEMLRNAFALPRESSEEEVIPQ